MKIGRRVLMLGIAGLLAVPGWLAAQSRQITGTVSRSGSGEPIAEATVALVGTTTVARTDAAGRYSITASGEARLMFRAIGFTRREAVVPAGQSTMNVTLDQDIFRLDEVIVSGAATQVERRAATTAIAVVGGEEIAKVAAPTFEAALNGRISGVNIQSNSGAPGGGIQMQIRGNTTVLGSSDPLFVVDGVIYSNSRINGGRASAVAGADVDEDDPINRVADINPADIASIEVLKGAAASSIYGSKASNGVVVIKTIRGQPGQTRANVSQRFGTFDLQRTLQSRNFENLEDAVDAFGESKRAAMAPYFASGVPQTYDLYEQVFGRNALSYETVADVSGGSEQTRYFISGTWKRDEGIADNTGFGRQGIRVNVDQKLSEKLDVSVSSVFNRSLAQRGFTNNGNNGGTAGYALAYQPNFQSLLPDASGLFTEPALTSQGAANPLQTHRLSRNETEANRFTGGVNLNWRPFTTEKQSFAFTAGAGVDIFNQADDVYTPNELFWERTQAQPGTALEQSGVSRQMNWNLNGVHTFRPTSGTFTATTSFGVQYEDRQLKVTRATNTNLVPGQSNVNRGTTPVVNEEFTLERTLAFYGQEDLLLLDDRLLVSGGLRAERSSANGDVGKYYIFPKISGSYRFTNLLGANSFKLRAAYGETGNQPIFGQKFTTLNTPQFGGLNGFTLSTVAGAPNIEPERLREVEAGFEAEFFSSRLVLDVTYYNRNTTNLLLNRTPPPSSGFTSEVFNGGKVQNQGVELSLGVTPIQSRSAQLVTRGTFTLNRNKVLELPVASFRPPNSGFGGLGVTFVEVGQPMTQIVGFGFDEDTVRIPTQMRLGNSAPDFRVGFVNDLTVKAFNFSMVWDWQQGGNIINLTQFLYDDAANAADFGSAEHAYRMRGLTTGVMTPYIEDASFLKLRELSVGVNLPRSFANALSVGARDVRLSVTGRNLILLTNYSGLDPEVANFGSGAIRNNLDVAPFPPSRSVFFNIAVGF
ncbi:MAG: SusC/RagA family TonB-linked outer membrane protein [Gemmatimonadales bacterium]